LPDVIRSGTLPNRNYIFEFDIEESERTDGFQAMNIDLVSKL